MTTHKFMRHVVSTMPSDIFKRSSSLLWHFTLTPLFSAEALT